MPTDEPDTDEILAGLVALVRRLNPTAKKIRVLYECDGMRGVLPVPVALSESEAVEMNAAEEMAEQIVDVLTTVNAGEWMAGAALAHTIDESIDHRAGTFVRAVRILKLSGRIVSHPRNGYRLSKIV